MQVRNEFSSSGPSRPKLVLLWCALALGACLLGFLWSPKGAQVVASPGLSLRKVARSLAVYPRQSLPLKFSHRVHLGQGIGCNACHKGVELSTRSQEQHLPSGRTCDGCHGPSHPPPPKAKRACAMCHEVNAAGHVAKSVSMPAPRLNFSHRAHKDRPCAECHGDLSRVDLATRDQLPTEAMCLRCHSGKPSRRPAKANASASKAPKIAGSDCQLCHPVTSAGRLQTGALGADSLSKLLPRSDRRGPMAHDLRFVFDHGAVAAANRKACLGCHQETFCTDCHSGSLRPLQIHPGGYLGSHGMDARTSTDRCMSCHQRDSDCRACHLRFGISDAISTGQRPGSPGPDLQFHPPGFASTVPGAAQPHASQARMNMSACASCHSEDSCLACHATTRGPSPGLSANPHGPNFVASGRCKALATRNRRVCLKCHAPGQPALDCSATPTLWR